MKLKVCGIKTAKDLKELDAISQEFGFPNFVGHIFFKGSSRDANDNIEELVVSSNIVRVGVFVNEDPVIIDEICSKLDIRTIQLHGDESPSYCSELKNKYTVIKALSISKIDETAVYQNSIDCLLIDNNKGGSGISYDWNLILKNKIKVPFFIAGGIGIKEYHAISKIDFGEMFCGIDVNSKFETASGSKDFNKLKELCYELSKSK